MKALISIICSVCVAVPAMNAQTDAFIKIHDSHARHPRVTEITFPGNTVFPADYDAIYGHGAIIENPWVAYRVYMDNRQSLDLYAKTTPRLEVDETCFYTTPQQLASGYGCDVLWAGKSVAAGSFRGWQNNNPTTIDSVATRTHRVLNNHSIEVQDKDWTYNGRKLQMTQRYSMLPDSRDLFVEISLTGYEPSDLFCTGIQKLETDNQGFIDPKGNAGSWGSNIPDKAHPELIETVGLGIEVEPDNLVQTIEDDVNYLMIVRPDAHGRIRYRVSAAALRQTDGFKSADQWFNYLKSNIKNK
ncbi:MAG: DUF4861 domain-containing protein [Muribaculum sp.]|nr:DUF4861 domain-containing protein [Muribaculaceae bacterium]MCM1080402.1 DUF4861 domain-containing protein [Muribaculum sp.]